MNRFSRGWGLTLLLTFSFIVCLPAAFTTAIALYPLVKSWQRERRMGGIHE